jgi:hypothetical protein
MKIIAKQATNKVNTIKLPDGQHTQTGKETLKEFTFIILMISNDGLVRPIWTYADT